MQTIIFFLQKNINKKIRKIKKNIYIHFFFCLKQYNEKSKAIKFYSKSLNHEGFCCSKCQSKQLVEFIFYVISHTSGPLIIHQVNILSFTLKLKVYCLLQTNQIAVKNILDIYFFSLSLNVKISNLRLHWIKTECLVFL